MSTVLGVVKNGVTIIGADTQATTGNGLMITGNVSKQFSKIVKATDNVYVGVVGAAISVVTLEKFFMENKVSEALFSSKIEIFNLWMLLHSFLKDCCGLVSKPIHEDLAYEDSCTDCLIVAKSGIYSVTGDRFVQSYSKFWSLGSGSELAIGAMNALYDKLENPIDIARQALIAAAKFDSSTSKPFHFKEIKH